MNILLLVKRFDYGGSENHVCDLANALFSRGHRVIVASKPGRQTERLNKGVAFRHLALSDVLLPLLLIQLLCIIVRNRIQVIHAHQRLPILAAAIIGKITGCQSVGTVHGQTRYDLKHVVSRKWINHLIFVNKYTLQSAGSLFPIAGKSVYIPNPAYTNTQSSNCGNAQDLESPRICLAGRLSKSFIKLAYPFSREVLPAVLEQHPGLKLLIVGDDHKLKNRPCMHPCVQFMGFHKDITECFEGNMLVLGSGRVAMEAASAGIPVFLITRNRMGGLMSFEKYFQVRHTNFVDCTGGEPDWPFIAKELSAFFQNAATWKKEALRIQLQLANDFQPDQLVEEILRTYRPIATEQLNPMPSMTV